MGTILSLLKKFQQLDTAVVATESIDETREVIKQKQRDQLLQGLKADGTKIGKYRNSFYAEKKHAQNPLAGFGNVDLKLTGDLYSELFVDVRSSSFVIDSADEKTGELVKKYGDPFGLTSDSKVEYINESLQKVFVDNIKKIVSL